MNENEGRKEPEDVGASSIHDSFLYRTREVAGEGGVTSLRGIATDMLAAYAPVNSPSRQP